LQFLIENKEDKENIDIFDNLPIKDENNLKIMKIKLKDDSWYRNQMSNKSNVCLSILQNI